MTKEEWWEMVARELKGKDPSGIIRDIGDGVTADPLYTKEEMGVEQQVPGRFPYRRGMGRADRKWEMRERFSLNGRDPEELHEDLRKSIEKKGASSVGIYGNLNDPAILEKVFSGLSLDRVAVCLENPDETFAEALLDRWNEWGEREEQKRGTLGLDPIGEWLRKGDWKQDKNGDLNGVERLLSRMSDVSPFFAVVEVGAHRYHEAGASPVQELAYAMAQGVEYLDHLTEAGHRIDDISPRIGFSFAIGSDILVEIAKLRAARELWARILSLYGPEHVCTTATRVHGRTSAWGTTVLDAYNNIVRTTTQAFAGICGNVDELSVRPFDAGYQDPSGFARRIAMNIHHLLAEEGKMAKVADPLGGSWYLERLTNELGEKAWTELQRIEEAGGCIDAIEKEYIQENIKKKREAAIRHVETGELPLVGANVYPNEEETPPVAYQDENGEQVSASPDIQPLRPVRAASELEKRSSGNEA